MCRNKLYNQSAGGFIGVRNPADFFKTIMCFYADIKLLGFRQEKKLLQAKSAERDITLIFERKIGRGNTNAVYGISQTDKLHSTEKMSTRSRLTLSAS